MMNIKNEQSPLKMEHSQIAEYQTKTFVTQQKCSTHPIPIAAQEDRTRLSFVQQRLWFLDQLEGTQTAYNIPIALQLTGKLNTAALEHSLHELVRRHDILRTTFPAVAGHPQAVIQATDIVSLTIIDLQALTAQERVQKREYLIHEFISRSFNLAEEPLMRTTLLQLAPQEHILLITLHQLIFDNTSIEILIAECAELYQAFCQQKPSPLPPLPIQYADFAVWQRQQCTETSLATQLSYWKQQLAGVPSLLTLPTDYPRPPVQKFQGTSYQFHFNTALTQALNTLSQQHQVTLLTTLYSAFVCLLARYSGQSDIVVGTPISDRVQPQTEPLIGCFINILALRLTLTDNPSFTQLLKRAQQIISQANAHSELPFEQVIEALNIERNLSYSPLCQVLFVMATPARRALSVPGLTLTPLSVAAPGARFDLSLSIEITEQGLVGMLEYNTDLFEPSTIERFSDHFQTLLASIVTTPEQPIAQLSLLTEAQRHQLLVEWNNTQVDYPQDKCIHQLFEEQVARTPDAVAVVFEEHTLSYQQLNAKANQLARYLQTFDVKPEVLVGLFVERSLEMIIGLLGILKAGGAYVPLDPLFPPQRLAFMLTDGGVNVLVTQSSLIGHVPAYKGQVIYIENKEILSLPGTNLTPIVQTHHLAYVIYTSGSTGQPKGVQIEHSSLTNFLYALQDKLQLSSTDSMLSVTTISFDIAALELYLPLLVGAQIRLVSREMAVQGEHLLKLLDDVTVMQATPATWSLLLAAGWHYSPKLTILVGGEAVPEPLAESLRFRSNQVWNVYGPTETTVWSSSYPIAKITNTLSKTVPIGRPLANTQVYVLDHQLQPVPIGVAGELYIGGDGVARGYLNHVELTKEKFIYHSFSTQHSTRLYRTGDLVRYLPQGDLVFLGRLDHQVKIRGFRIELSEIEATLGKHSKIKTSAVIIHERSQQDRRLIAYFVPTQEKIEIRELRAFLRRSLPEYMIPSTFISLNALPLTPNGKVDRQALRRQPENQDAPRTTLPRTVEEKQLVHIWTTVLGLSQPISIHDNFFALGGHSLLVPQIVFQANQLGLPLTLNQLFQYQTIAELAAVVNAQRQAETEVQVFQPSTSTEEVLISLWQTLFGIQSISIHDDFFELGGHSLLATQMIIRIQQLFSVTLSIRQLFESPTIASLTPLIETLRHQAYTPLLQRFKPVARSEQLPLSFAQQRLWFLDQLLPETAFYNIAVGFHIQGTLELDKLEQSLNELIGRHETLRTIFVCQGDEAVQQIQAPFLLSIPLIDLQTLPAAEQIAQAQHIAAQEAQIPFQLSQGPLLRMKAVQLNAKAHILLLTIHHIIADAWSIQLFFHELLLYYQSFIKYESVSLPPLSIQYADFAYWQRQWFSKAILATQLTYWQQQLAQMPPLLALPTDKPRPSVQTYHGSRVYFQLDSNLVKQLDTLSHNTHTTLFVTLLSALVTVLFRYTGQHDIAVGCPIAQRNHAELEPLIGFFINTLILRTQLQPQQSFNSLLTQLHEVLFNAYDHQEVPFEKLVEEIQPERNISHTPLVQVTFSFQNLPTPSVAAQTLSIEPFEFDDKIARFDLEGHVWEVADGLRGCFIYNTDLFDSGTIERLSRHFQTILAAAVVNPQQPLNQLSLLTTAEQQQLLQWQQSRIDFPCTQCIHQLFERQVEKTPQAIALTFADQQLTYAGLNYQANQLAHYLRDLGVKPEVMVGLLFSRSLTMIIGLLGILKAGGAYVPLDPDYPQERIQGILTDSEVPILLTEAQLLNCSDGYPGQVICLDKDWNDMSRYSPENPNVDVQANQLIYVIYTSGSTGKPKGTLLTHRNVVRLFQATERYYHFNQNDVWTLFHSIAFDFSVWELWGALLYGGRLVIVPYLLSRSPQEFYELLVKEQVSVLNQTPSAFRQLIQVEESVKETQALKLRYLILGGEALELNTLKPWFERHGDKTPQLINMYGITETTVHVTYRALSQTDLNAKGSVIGHPLPDLELYIFDEYQNLVPIGIPGELYVGGAGVAQGYLNRSQLTAQRFSANPFYPTEKLYKTGDQARYLPNGDIEYLGRIDHQVKIRGFRVELGEIEALLIQFPKLREAVVSVRADELGHKRLIAYVVMEADETLAPQALRKFLRIHLPEYMLPAQYVQLPQLPLTPNGKIDRQALPAPLSTHKIETVPFNGLVDQLEQQLILIWEKVLGIYPIRREDNFFDLGGHSLLAITLLNRIEKVLGKKVPLLTLFQAPTIEQFAQVLPQSHQLTSTSPWVVIQAGDGRTPPLFMIQVLGQGLKYGLALARHLGTDQAIYGLSIGLMEYQHAKEIRGTQAKIFYTELVRSLQPQGPYLLVGVYCGGRTAFEVAQHLYQQGQSVALLALVDTRVVVQGQVSIQRLSFRERIKAHGYLLSQHKGDYLRQIPRRLRNKIKRHYRRWKTYYAQFMLKRKLPLSAPLQELLFEKVARTKFNYKPKPYPGQLTLFRAQEQKLFEDPEPGWRNIAAGGLKLHDIPGDHVSIWDEPNVQILAKELKDCIQEALEEQQ